LNSPIRERPRVTRHVFSLQLRDRCHKSASQWLVSQTIVAIDRRSNTRGDIASLAFGPVPGE
jgi:hypothetical protein